MRDTTTLPAPDRGSAGGRVLGRYELDRRLGTGGFGTVWLAHDHTLDRPVAVKVVARTPGSNDAGSRAMREGLAAARLNHPAIVALYEAGTDAHAHYLVSELVEGATLADLEHHEALSDRDVVRIGLALCGALSHAHERGVIHRDVKPHNVVVPREPQSAAGLAKLTDFGVAHLVDEHMTHTGDVIGTLAYMAPEQAEGDRIGPGTDLYSLGLVLYEALTGVNPVRRAGAAATARRLGTQLSPVRRQRRGLPPVLSAAIDRAVRPRPEQRGTVDELAQSLEAALPLVSDQGGAIRVDPDRWDAGDERWDQGDAFFGEPDGPAGSDWIGDDLVAPRARAHHGWKARTFGGLTAAGLAAAAAVAIGPADPATPAIAAAAAAVTVGVLPRLGFLLGVAWLAIALAALEPGRAGSGLLVAAALLLAPLLLPRRPAAWSLPAAGAGLGALGLAGAFPALAGMAAGLRARAALGFCGLWCLAIAEALADRTFLVGPADGTAAPAGFERSGDDVVTDVLEPLFSSGLLALGVVWGLAASALPWLVRGHTLGGDMAGAIAWAAALSAGQLFVAAALHGPVTTTDPRGAVTGALLGAVAAVGVRAARRRDRRPHKEAVFP